MLPEYLAVRERYSFEQICETPELAALVTIQPIRRFALDAAIIFSDILVVASALGMDVTYFPEMQLKPAIRKSADITRLSDSNLDHKLSYVRDALNLVRAEVGPDFPVLGFAGAPFTLACYMVSGGKHKNFYEIKVLLHQEPAVYHQLMALLTRAVISYLQMQIATSVDAVQLFDTWAGELAREDYDLHVLPYIQKITDSLRGTKVPVIYYINGIRGLVESVNQTGATVLGIDWRTSLSEIRRRLGGDRVVQGNLDPAVLYGSESEIRRRVFAMLNETNGIGHIVNLGHGVYPTTPLSGVEALLNAVAAWAEFRKTKDR